MKGCFFLLHYYRTFRKNLETLYLFLLADKQMHLTLLCCLATQASPEFLYMKNQHAANLETYRVQCEGDQPRRIFHFTMQPFLNEKGCNLLLTGDNDVIGLYTSGDEGDSLFKMYLTGFMSALRFNDSKADSIYPASVR